MVQLPVQLPYVLGSDLASVVTEIGTKVTQVKPGDRVMGIPVNNGGAYADYVAVEENALAAIELALSFQEAAALPTVGLTAWQALFKYGKLQPGQRILIHAGAGGVGKEQKLKVIIAIIKKTPEKFYDNIEHHYELNGANHRMSEITTYPFNIFGCGWKKVNPTLE